MAIRPRYSGSWKGLISSAWVRVRGGPITCPISPAALAISRADLTAAASVSTPGRSCDGLENARKTCGRRAAWWSMARAPGRESGSSGRLSQPVRNLLLDLRSREIRDVGTGDHRTDEQFGR